MQGGFACAGSSAVEAFVAGLDWYRSAPAFALLDAAAEPCHRLRPPRTQEVASMNCKYEYAVNRWLNCWGQAAFYCTVLN